MTWHCRWLHIKILGKNNTVWPPFSKSLLPSQLGKWNPHYVFSTGDGHPSSIAAVSPVPIPYRAQGWQGFWRLKKTVLTKWQGGKKKEKEVIFPVKDQGKRHHLPLQWQQLWGLLRDIPLVHFWLPINAHIKICGEIKATSNTKSMKDL